MSASATQGGHNDIPCTKHKMIFALLDA